MGEVVLQSAWGWQIAMYLFLGGLGAGSLLVAGIVSIKTKGGMPKTVRFGAWAGVICLIVGVLLLLSEVTMPLRAVILWQSFSHFGSWMTIGAWLLVVGIAVSGVWALSLTDAVTAKVKFLRSWALPLSWAACVMGVCIAAYTGVLLSVLDAHPLWNTPLLPVLFTVSAIDTGVALVALYGSLRKEPTVAAETETNAKKATAAASAPASADVPEPTGEGIPLAATGAAAVEKPASAAEVVPGAAFGLGRALEKATLALVVVEAVVLVLLLAMVGSDGEVGALSVGLLTMGTLAVPFWLLFVIVGLAAPATAAVMSLKAKAKPWIPLAGAVCCLVGGCALRFLILMAGLPVWAL